MRPLIALGTTAGDELTSIDDACDAYPVMGNYSTLSYMEAERKNFTAPEFHFSRPPSPRTVGTYEDRVQK